MSGCAFFAFRRALRKSRGVALQQHTTPKSRGMSGTWLQEGYYGSDLVTSPGLSGTETDHELLAFARGLHAVAAARKLCRHSWVVVTAIFRANPTAILAPRSHAPLDPACWLAFVDRADKHQAPGWSQVPLVLFPEWERNANIIKVMPPLLFDESSVFYLDLTLTRARCFAFPHLVRGKELASAPVAGVAPTSPLQTSSTSSSSVHLFASAIPSWSGRSSVPVQLDMTRAWIARRNDTKAAGELLDLEDAMRADVKHFNSSSLDKRLIPDTMFMAWPREVRHSLGQSTRGGSSSEAANGDGDFNAMQQMLSRGWFHEVARRSAYEKASFAWVASKLPTPLRKLFVSSLYIYEPEQRCCSKFPNGTAEPCRPKSPGDGATGKKKAKKKRGMMKRRRSSRRLTTTTTAATVAR